MGEGVHAVVWWGNQWKRPLRRPRHSWEGNIKTDLKEIRWGRGWDDMLQDRDR